MLNDNISRLKSTNSSMRNNHQVIKNDIAIRELKGFNSILRVGNKNNEDTLNQSSIGRMHDNSFNHSDSLSLKNNKESNNKDRN